MSATVVLLNTVTGQSWAIEAATVIAGSFATKPTEKPVERGVSITDHVQQLAEKVSIKGMISESGPKGKPSGAARVTAWQAFLRGLATGQPCTITAYRYGTMENMVLTASPFAVTIKRGIEVDLSFQQIRVVTTAVSASLGASSSASTITVGTAKLPEPTSDTPSGENLVAPVNTAAQPTTPVAPTEKQASVALVLSEWMGLT